MKNLFVSFSGGESSGAMLHLCLTKYRHLYGEIKVLFANTGQENEETLEFVRRVSELFDVEVIWIECIVGKKRGRGVRHRVVDYDTATRDDSLFESVVQEYGLPNNSFPHCTRELKTRPMYSYLASIGWRRRDYDVAIGIRADEMDRVDPKRKEKGIVYPLIEWEEWTKPMVNSFWDSKPFRLDLKGYQGNCTWCWKKSLRKHVQLYRESPQIFVTPDKFDRLYAESGAGEGVRRMFRKHRTTQDIIAIARDSDMLPPDDDSVVYHDDLDSSHGCSESCEVEVPDEEQLALFDL